MKDRCYNERVANYGWYGGRGIRVCPEWLNSFEEFEQWALENGYKPELQLDRFPDNDGNYEPSNCRWATRAQQQRNTRQSGKIIAFGEIKAIAAWAEDSRCKVCYSTLRTRLLRGWDVQQAILKEKQGLA
jgi:hypothetical protein